MRRKHGLEENTVKKKKRTKASKIFIKKMQEDQKIKNKLLDDNEIEDSENEEEEYNPYEWRSFRHFECAKVLMNNFTHFPAPINLDTGFILLKNEKFGLLTFLSKFLPFMNIYISCRLVLYEIMIVGLQNLPTLQILPLLIIEIFVTYSVVVGHFVHKCFLTRGFFRYMCQQLTIVLLLTQSLMGTFSWGVRVYSKEGDNTGGLETVENLTESSVLEQVVIVCILTTLVTEILEIFGNIIMSLKSAWIRGGKQGRKGIWRIVGSNEGDTVFLENLLG